MHASRPLFAPFALLISGAFSLTAASASAGQSCKVDSDCEHGFDCEVVAASGCAAPSCPPGADCPQPACDPTEIKECVPGPCQAHSDCADGMVCYALPSTTTCTAQSTPACPPNTKCDIPPPQPADCTTTTMNRCVPRYSLPCTTDSGCGDGFNCVPDPDECGCSGSGGTGIATPPSSGPSTSGGSAAVDAGVAKPLPPSTAPAPQPLPPPDCTCTPSTTKHCTPKATTCTVDSDCPSTWTCTTVNVGVACGGSAERLPDGGTKITMFDCGPPPPAMHQCQAPSYGGGYYGVPQAAGLDGNATSGTVGHGTSGVGGGVSVDKGGSVPPTSGAPSGSPSPSNGTGGAYNGADEEGAYDGKPAGSSDSSGCQMGAGQSDATGAAVIGLLGLAGLMRRRRQSRWG